MWQILLGPVLEIINKTIDKLVPDVAAAAKIKLEMQQELMRQDFSLIQAQLDINKEEAKHDSVFVAGWRPFCGWACASSLAYTFVAQPFLAFALSAFGIQTTLPVLDYGALMTILLGMLGLSASRSYEKVKGESTTATKVGA